MTSQEADQKLYAEEARRASRSCGMPPLLDRDPPTNWPEMINRMLCAGYSKRGIAAAINVAESTLRDWYKVRATPNYEDGKALVALFHELFPVSARNPAP